MLYVYIHPDGSGSLFGVYMKDDSFEAPTFFEAMKMEPEFVAVKEGTLVFKDVIIEVRGAE
jgi:hypothetical protein